MMALMDVRQPPRVNYDALLLVSFGGPEAPDEVMPFLERVLQGRRVPRERMLKVAEHYHHFGGKSPINDQNRALMAALGTHLRCLGIDQPILWGNRNWHPLLTDTLREMASAGIQRALAIVTSAYSSYSSCRQYLEDIARAREAVGPEAPVVDKIRPYFNHPGFVGAVVDRVRKALGLADQDRVGDVPMLFTAHSVPVAMARGSAYEKQLQEVARIVAEHLGADRWRLVYQSRSGPPSQPWLEPDVCRAIEELHSSGHRGQFIVVPIGFVSDHMEVVYDLDTEARQVADSLGLKLIRAATVGTHPQFIAALGELIRERLEPASIRQAVGTLGPCPDECPADCCPSGRE
jgi:ferrochelatase